MLSSFVAVLLSLSGCDVPPPPQATKPAAPTSTCDLDLNKLGGTSWVYNAPQSSGGFKLDPSARLRFRDEGGRTFGDYTAGSSGSVYKYECTVKGQIGTCVEIESHADGFCKAWAAVHDGVCDPEAVAAATGIPVDEVKKVADGVNAELKKLKKDEREMQRKVDNSPNNKIRGKFKYAIDKKACSITLQDKYLTMVDGKLNELENIIQAGQFIKADKDYVFESCEDPDSAWAPGPDDTHLAVQPAGTIKFSAILQGKEKGGAGCTYTADLYKDWVKAQEGIASTDDKKWGPRFDASVPLTDKGRHVVYFDRYKTCGDKKERIGFTCAMVRVE